ncbi:hypothetical protein DSL72_002429 [Monilinia vaccinii-corymbosi]|uniref:Uncharacterized protein n=1 Tax=Monilinia vaccinii-corymbosi TaxID=61207 RepID=A0A8A3PCN7_9HELO|nr:hypothetical protein DSL72_002429 [Monilinia vaccinii-corymbosi]
MFEHFTFGAAPTNPCHSDDDDDDDVQPCPRDESILIPSSPPSTNSYPFFNHYEPSSPLDDVINQLGQHSLSYEHTRNSQYRQYISPTPSLSDDSGTSSPINATQSVAPAPPPSGFRACRRRQRQLNVQLQCSTSHIRDISTLVEDMLFNNSQCNLRRSPPECSIVYSPISPLEVDPGTQDDWNGMDGEKAKRRWLNTVIDDLEGNTWDREGDCLSLKSASTPSGIRKRGLRCGMSMESVGGVRSKVAKAPRMRIRKGKEGSGE